MILGMVAQRRRGGATTDPYFSSVKLLVPFDGTDGATTANDLSSSPATLTFSGAAELSNAQAKFGATSLSLDGATGSRVQTNRAQLIGLDKFTLEAHCRPAAASTMRIVSSQDLFIALPVICFRVDSTGAVTFILRNAGGTELLVLTSAAGLVAMNDSAWYHIAVTRNASNRIDIWIDGVSVANATSGTNPNTAPAYNIGSFWGGSGTAQEIWNGYLANVRITEGVCRYTATFTPPSALYPTS